MPQMSPLMWPFIYLTLIHFLSMVMQTLQEVQPRTVYVKPPISIYKSNQWKW